MVLHRVSVAAAAAAVAVAAVVLFAGGGNLAEAAYTKCGPMLRPLLPNDKQFEGIDRPSEYSRSPSRRQQYHPGGRTRCWVIPEPPDPFLVWLSGNGLLRTWLRRNHHWNRRLGAPVRKLSNAFRQIRRDSSKMLKDFSKNALNSIGLNRKKESPIRRGGLAYNITQESGSKSKSPLNLEAVLKKLVPDPLRKRLEKDWRDMTKSWDPVAGVLGLAQNMSKTAISSVETVSANLTDQVKTDFHNAFITLGMIGSNPRESNQTSNPASSIIQRTQNASDGTSISAEVLLVNLIEEVEEDFRDAFDELTKNFTPVASVFQLAQNMSDIFVSSVESGSANLTDQVKGDFRNALSTLSKIGSNPGEFLISASQTPLGKFVDPYNWTSQAIHKYTELRERVGNVTLMFKDSDFIDPNRDKEGIAHVLRMIPKLVPFLIDQKLPELYRFLLLGREFTVDDLFAIHEALENLDAFLGDTSEDLSDYDAPTAEAILALLRSRNMDVMLFILRLMYEADSGDKDQQQTVILNEKHLKALQERFVTANDIFSLLV